MTSLRQRTHLRTTRVLQSLLQLYQTLRTPQPIDTLLQQILDTAIRTVPGVQRGSLLVREDNELCYHAAVGYDLEQLRHVSFSATAILDLLDPRQRVSQIVDFTAWDKQNLSDETNRILQEHGHVDQIRRSLVASIAVAGQFYGMLVLDNLYNHAAFPATAESLAALFAEQAGTLIEHAMLLDQLRRTNVMLVESERLASLGRLVAGVAHEINNPLTAVIGNVELLSACQLGPEAQASLQQIQIGAERVRGIVRNLQMFARQQHLGESEVDLNGLIRQTLALRQSELALDRIDVRIDLVERLPLIWGDSGQLGQVLLNLIVNAQHALRMRDEPRVLTLRAWVEGPILRGLGAGGEQRVVVSVADNGPGIAPEHIARLFEPFFTTKPVGEGTGLGLSVCYGIITNHGGRIRARSHPYLRTTFVFELPVRPVPRELAQPVQPEPSVLPPQHLRVLLVEDDGAVVQLVRRALPDNALTVAAEGGAALRLLDQGPIDVVLCDIKMPGMGGQAFFEHLRQATPALAERLLFISGDSSSAETQEFLRGSGRPLLSKPFTPSELYRALAALGVDPAPDGR